jgi:hypothetical protein
VQQCVLANGFQDFQLRNLLSVWPFCGASLQPSLPAAEQQLCHDAVVARQQWDTAPLSQQNASVLVCHGHTGCTANLKLKFLSGSGRGADTSMMAHSLHGNACNPPLIRCKRMQRRHDTVVTHCNADAALLLCGPCHHAVRVVSACCMRAARLTVWRKPLPPASPWLPQTRDFRQACDFTQACNLTQSPYTINKFAAAQHASAVRAAAL